MSSERIAVAMSGGLDSSVVAWLLAQEEKDVVGLSMLLWDKTSEATHGRCCGALDLGDARRVAEQCGIPHFTLRMDEEFERQVVDPFVDDYLEGRTPIPCTRCNTFIKFDLFLERARKMGVTRMATGHYARIERGETGWELHQAVDLDKDQSYYLFELTQDQLAASRFPLGGMAKPAVRDLARQAKLLVAEKGESMELCFVAGGIKDFIEDRLEQFPERYGEAEPMAASRLEDSSGELLGEGEPYYRYTVGQRRGLGLTSKSPLYVLGVEPERNAVQVGPESELAASGLLGERQHWIGEAPEGEIEATVKIRSRHAGVRSLIKPLAGGVTEVEFLEPQKGVAPGQAAVFYDGSRVLGGCWIRAAV